ncbi:ElyC/SanA/YdcF family protein [Rarobacter incanus]|uniref:Ig-like protein group 3 n=1 Tax=Rarobacter incanus TaxID=153494 RepID=A0A542SLS9_9MICO|nr:ElyC/SanA/YdcF family protein [Rarobacter incanus]TQK75580.1 Ig-like protein group 3 [Rarobacter incanus]
MTLHRNSRRAPLIALALATALLPGVISAPVSSAASAATIAQTEAKIVEFQRIGLLDDVEDQLAELKKLDPAEGKAYADATHIWNDSLSNFTVQGSTDATNQAGIPDGLPNDPSHVFVVLGHVLNKDGTPQQQLLDRVAVAKTAAAKYPLARIMVTGGYGASGQTITTEGEVMHDLLVASGIPESRIIVENASFDTPNNATMSMDKLYDPDVVGTTPVKSVSLITASWHMRRGTVLYQFASRLHQVRNGDDHLIEVKAGAACMTSACQNTGYVEPPGYPNASERNLIAQNVAKLSGEAVGGSDGNGGALAEFRTGSNGLRRAIAKFVYLQREGFDGNPTTTRSNVLDVRRAIAELGDISGVYGREFGALQGVWDKALSSTTVNSSIPSTGIPSSGHAFVVLGADGGSGTATTGRLDLAKAALTQYPNSIAVVAGNQAEINAGYQGLVSRGIDASRIVRTQVATNAQTGAFQTVNMLYSLGNISSYTLITSGDYVRRPTVLFTVADILRRNAWGATNRIEMLGHIAESVSGRNADQSLPDSSKRSQIVDNVDDLFDISSSELASWTNPAPSLSTLDGLTATAPTKTEYLVGDDIDATGFTVSATLSNGTDRAIDITDIATVKMPSTEVAGNVSIDASYMYRGATKSVSLPIVVRAADVTALTSIMDEGSAVPTANYTEASYAALAQALTNAQTVAADVASTPEQVARATAAVRDAIDGLELLRPTATITISQPHADGSYYIGTTASVDATAPTAARYITSIEYSLGGAWLPYTGKIVLPQGNVTLSARATDSSGSVSEIAVRELTVVKKQDTGGGDNPGGGGNTSSPSAVKLSAAVTSSRYGAGSTATIVALAAGVSVNTGTVFVTENGKTLGSARIASGIATVKLPRTLAVGRHTVTVAFEPSSGSDLVASSQRKAASFVITKVSPAKITAKRTSGKAKTSKRIKVRVRISTVAGAPATGKVTLRLGGKVVGKSALRKVGGFYQATIKTKKLRSKGKIRVTYSGNSTYSKRSVTTKVEVKRG